MSSTLPPPPPRPDLETMFQNWDDMVARLQRSEQERQTAHDLNVKLVAETEQLRERLEEQGRQLNYYRNFSIGIVERVATMGDLADKTLEEARQFAKEAPHAVRPAPIVDRQTEQELGETDVDIGDVIRRLHPTAPVTSELRGAALGGDTRLPNMRYQK